MKTPIDTRCPECGVWLHPDTLHTCPGKPTGWWGSTLKVEKEV